MLTIIADSNVAHLTDYFNTEVLKYPIDLIAMSGRDINAAVLNKYQPDALIIRSVTKVNSDLLADNSSVKFVGSATIGTDHVDQAYLHNRGIRFANAAGCSKHSVAQYVITVALTLCPAYCQQPITLGIIGLGNIGSTLAQYAADLGWQVLGYDPLLPASATNNASLEQLLVQSDVISLHVPLTTGATSQYPTYHMINNDTLKLLKPTALLINSARGQVINEAALIAALNKNDAKTHLQAVLDVFEYEPTVSARLLNHLSIATPHIAGYTLEGKLRGTQMVFDNFVTHFMSAINPQYANNSQQANDPQQAKLMSMLLPDNPYAWSYLQANPDKLPAFYDIIKDDRILKNAIDTATKQVRGTDFDALRKNYPLRREWVYD